MHNLRKLFTTALLCCSTGLADEVLNWNVIAADTLAASGQNAPQQSRSFAIVQIAVYDAINSIEGRYTSYVFKERATPNASAAAAVLAAAHDALLGLLPAQKSDLDSAYTAALAALPSNAARADGVTAGQRAAAAVLASRRSDGADTETLYTPGNNAGEWRPTPPAFLPAVLPGWGAVTPFGLVDSSQFRPEPPPPLDSDTYAADYNEVKAIGAEETAVRSDEQSEIAKHWYEPSPQGWNRIARNLADQRGLTSLQTARLLALVHIAMADGFIAGFEAKYFYNYWRPVTAIRDGAVDRAAGTPLSPGWNAFLVTPAIPDYPSTHSVLGAATAEVLINFFGTDYLSFDTTSGAPYEGISRHYWSFSEAALENASSRVMAGIHFRTACKEGLKQGQKIGEYVFQNQLRPVK